MPPYITEPACFSIEFTCLFDSQETMLIDCVFMEIVKLQQTSCVCKSWQQLFKKSQFMKPAECRTERGNDREKTDKPLTGLLSNWWRKSCHSLTQGGPVRWFDGHLVKH
ncbi:unnamed protein product [marine sediment metagenome]|uniref:Uncharacterized protein n=1 Tax=marine sediment metagenome TaxID=412755 RepID=X1RN49_9ZZZZ